MLILIDFNGVQVSLEPNIPGNTIVVAKPIEQPVIKI